MEDNKKSEKTVTSNRKNRKFFKRIIVVSVIVLLVLSVLPFGIKYGIERVLVKSGAEQALLEDVDFNPFTGKIALHDLYVRQGTESPLHISLLNAQISWRDLFSKRVYLEHLALAGSSLSVREISDTEWNVAGIKINLAEEQEKEEGTSSPWEFGLGLFEIDSGQVMFSSMDLELQLDIDSLSVKDVRSWEGEQSAHIDFAGRLNDGKVLLNADVRPFSDTTGGSGEITVTDLSLAPFAQLLPSGVKGIEGVLKFSSRLEVVQDGAAEVTVMHRGTVSLKDFGIQSETETINSGNVAWTGQFNLTNKVEGAKFIMDGDMIAEKLSITVPEQKLVLLALDKLSVRQFKAEGLEKISILEIMTERLLAGKLSDEKSVPSQEAETLFQADRITITETAAEELNNLSMQSISIQEAKAFLRMNSDGTWHILDRLAKMSGTGHPEKEGEKESGEPFRISVADFLIGTGSSVRFEDESVEPPYRTELLLSKVQLQSIDSSTPEKKSPLSIEGKIGDYATVNFSGDIQPFVEQLTMQLKGKLEEIDLHPLSSYTGKLIGYTMDSGHLDGEIDLNITSGNIEGQNTLILKKMKMTPKDQNTIKKYVSELTISVETALSLLRDRDGTIHLKLPVTGNISDPKIGYEDIINRAIAGALKKAAFSYLKHAIQPYGTIISIVQFAGKTARIRLDPIAFEAGEVGLDPKAEDYLQIVAKLMKERPNIQVSICGKVASEDLSALFQKSVDTRKGVPHAGQSAQEPKGGPSLEQDTPPAEVIPEEDLLQLAEKRAMTIKKNLTEQHGIESNRLFLCNPEIDKDETAVPRVDLLI